MSIVERAADKLRRSELPTERNPSDEAPVRQPVHDHVAAAGERIGAGAQIRDEPQPTVSRPRLTVDFEKLRRAGLMAPISNEDMVSREYKRIKRPLLANVHDSSRGAMPNLNCCMVASAIPGEGKTFNAVNLALSMAKERDYNVVLVDGDVIKPMISRTMGVRDALGLTDILADNRLTLSDLVLETNVPRLSLLPAGQRHEDATELLASHRMNWFIDEVGRDPSRIVIIDSPPLLATAESQALALSVGQILVVVKAGSTNQNAVVSALSLITAPDKKVSLILNQSTKAHGDYYAGYYGGYYDGHETGI